jgi:AraC-like DNA-binding protein
VEDTVLKILKGRRLPFFLQLYIFIVFSLLIPLAIVTINNNDKLLQYSEAEIIQSAENNLNSVEKLMEMVCGNIITSTVNLSKDPLITDISSIKSYEQFQFNYNSMLTSIKINNKLKVMEYSDKLFFSLYFYLKGSDYIISTKNDIVPLDMFHDIEWIKTINETGISSGNVWMARKLPFDFTSAGNVEGYTNVISFIHNTTNFTTNSKAMLIVNIYEKELCNIVNTGGFYENSSVFVLSENATVVSHVDKSMLNKDLSQMPYIENILNQGKDSGYIIDNTGGQRTLYCFNKSSFNNWIFVGEHSLDLLLNRAVTLRNQTIFVAFGISMLFFLIAYLFSRHMTTPIRKLINTITSREEYQNVDKTNELNFLVNAFEQITKQEKYLNTLVNKNKISIKEALLLNLLKGNIKKGEYIPGKSMEDGGNHLIHYETDELQYKEIFPYFHYIIAIMLIDNQQAFHDRYTPDQRHFMRILMQRKCEELKEQDIVFQSVIYEEDKLAIVINLNTYDCIETPEILKNTLSMLQDDIKTSLGNTVSIGVSGCHHGIANIQEAVSEAMDAVRKKLIYGHGSLIFWNGENNGKSRYYYPFLREKRILNYINTGDIGKIEIEIHQLVQEFKEIHDISCENIIQVFNQLISATIKYFVENNTVITRVFPNIYNIYLEVAGKETLEDLQAYMIDFYKKTVSFSSINGDNEKNIKERIINYLNTHYRTEILFDKMADDLKISYSYIRKIVKSLTGKSVLDYINSLRVNEGKRLLRQTNMTIAEIASCLGYNNVQSFNRFFKKFEGITPGEFRSQTDVG